MCESGVDRPREEGGPSKDSARGAIGEGDKKAVLSDWLLDVICDAGGLRGEAVSAVNRVDQLRNEGGVSIEGRV